MRKIGDQEWKDETLEDWPENDFRIFVGDLGNEVNDNMLANAFKRYPSFAKARVVKNTITGKTRGYGFVSLRNMEDYIKAMREMNNKYIGNRPVTLSRSKWQEKSKALEGKKVGAGGKWKR